MSQERMQKKSFYERYLEPEARSQSSFKIRSLASPTSVSNQAAKLYLAKKSSAATLSTNLGDTTLESYQTNESHNVTRQGTNIRTDNILEDSTWRYKSPLRTRIISQTPLRQRLRIPQDKLDHQHSSQSLLSYMSYLGDCGSGETEQFHKKMKDNQTSSRNLSVLDSSLTKQPSENSYHHHSLRLKEMMQAKQMHTPNTELVTPTLAKQRTLFKNRDFFKVSRLLTHYSNMGGTNLVLQKASSIIKSPLRPAENNLRSLTHEIAENYAEFFNTSSMHKATAEYLKNYLLDKTDIARLFYSRKHKEFKEPLTGSGYYNEIEEITTSPTRGPLRDNISPSISVKPKFSNTGKLSMQLFEQLKLVNAELKEMNLQYKLREISTLSEHIVKKETDCKVKYHKLLKKLYNSNRSKYVEFKGLIDKVDRDHPYFKTGISNRLNDFEKDSGELTALNPKTREIGKAWDTLLTKWTQAYDNVPVIENN